MRSSPSFLRARCCFDNLGPPRQTGGKPNIMRCKACIIPISICLAGSVPNVLAQQGGAAAATSLPGPDDPIKALVDRLDLEKYKATIKGLTQFGDRRQGTERNRKAIDWIEAQLKS